MSKYLTYIGLLLISIGSYAQTGTGLNSFGSSKIDSKAIQLDTAERVFSPATKEVSLEIEETKEAEFKYDYHPDVETENISSKVAIYRLKITQEDDSKSGFVRAGIGNYASTLLDGYYGSRANDKFAWGLGLNHLGAVNGPVNKKESGYSDNKLAVGGKYFLNKYLVSGDIQYRRNVSKNYGYLGVLEERDTLNLDSSFSTSANKNAAQDIYFNVGLKSLDLKSPLQFRLNLEPRIFKLNDSLSEFDFNTTFIPSYELNTGKVKLEANYRINQVKDTSQLSRSLFHLKPSFEYLSEDKRLVTDIGLIFDFSNDTTLDRKLAVYPFIKGSYMLIEDLGLFVKGELSGGLKQNNINQSYRQNLWINQFVANTSNYKMKIDASLEATPLENLMAKVKLSYATIDNFNYFVNDSSDLSYYSNTYTESAVNVITPGIEVAYRFKGGHGLNFDLEYNNYGTKEELFYLPKFTTNLDLYYKVNNNLKISSDISYISGLVGSNALDNSTDKLSDIVDLNLKFDYEFNEKLGVFLYGNNLLSKKYNYYKYYPVQGINVLGGIKLSF